jgi:PAS domain S-box-containing protein
MDDSQAYSNLSNEELRNELNDLQNKYNLLKASFEKEASDKEGEKLILEKLISASEELIQFQEDTHDYSKILQIMLDISGARYAALNIFDPNGLDFTTVAVAGINEHLKKAISLLGFDLVNKHWKYDPLRAEMTKNQTFTRYENLHDLTNDTISKTIVQLLERTFNLGETIIIKVTKDNTVLGDFTMLFRKNETLIHDKMVKLFVQQAGMFIDRNRIINTLQESETRHSSMILNISDIIGIAASDNSVKYLSPNMGKWFGWKPSDLAGTDLFMTVHPDDLEQMQKAFLTHLKNNNSVTTVEYRFKCKDGSYKPIELTAANLVNDPNIKGILLNFRDITDRKKNEEEIRLKNEELTRLNAEKDKFFSIIAHDLRNPFSSFLTLTEILADNLPSLTSDEIHEIAVNMKSSAANLFSLLENLLEWSRIRQGLVPINNKVIQLLPKITESIDSVRGSSKIKGIEVVCEIPDGLEVYADPNILQTVIRNFLSNAVKFTPRGGRIGISSKTFDDKSVEISIQDSGIGMSQTLVNNLFRLDVPTNRKGTDGEPSTGLGLIICKDFIEKMGGKIWVESEERKGSVFHFTVPVSASQRINLY